MNTNDNEQPLPVALRDTEITEADLQNLLDRAQEMILKSHGVPPDIINDATNNPTNYAAVKIADKKGVM